MNYLIKDLKKVKLYNQSSLKVIQNYTRNGKVKVIYDQKKNFYFLDKILTNKNEYYEKNYHQIYSNKNLWSGKFYGKKFLSPKINEDKKKVKFFNKYIKNKIFLDFGCGFGSFAKEASRITKKTFVYDKSKICRDFILKSYKNIKVLNDLKNIDNYFDTITLIQTLHYLPKQIDELSNLRKKLKKKGKIIIEVPSSNDILLSKFNLQKFKDFTFCIESLLWHNEETLTKFLKKAGFRKINIKFIQRYDLNNHFGWLLKEKPGGHEFFKSLFNNRQRALYDRFLKEKKLTDTIIAIAEK